MKIRTQLFLFSFLSFINVFRAGASIYITVAADGSGDFKTINTAIASLPMFNYERAVIYIKNGVYNEKIRIEQDYVTLRGESRENTIIWYSQLRTDWIANKDSIGPAIINIEGDDIILENLTIENTQPEVGPHAFTIYGKGTRTILLNCNVTSKGGDTVSLWDYKTGMYYHANCNFVGAVDFVCPRGWCFIRDCKFYELKTTASIWHAGGYDETQKLVVRNSSFDGVKGFELGRHHYDSQFFLLDCIFSDSMADKPIYRVGTNDPKTNRPFNWGKRYYFYNCHRKGGDFDWFKDNLNTNKDKLRPETITCDWTFEGKWKPESKKGPKVLNYQIQNNTVFLNFDEAITLIKVPVLKSTSGKTFTYDSGSGSNTLQFKCGAKFSKEDLAGLQIVNDAKMLGTIASVTERNADLKVK